MNVYGFHLQTHVFSANSIEIIITQQTSNFCLHKKNFYYP